MTTPDFFIVGAPKCATSALYHYLKMHPDIFMSVPKELNYFATDVTSPYFVKDKKQYLSLFDNSANYKRVGEASVWHLYSKEAANGIHEMVPDAKIIIMIRNPVDMIYSYHGQRLFNGTEDITDFADAILAIPDRKQGKRLPKEPYPIEGLFYLDIANYTEQIKRYIDKFGKKNVHVIIFDDFKTDSRTEYAKTLEFLGLGSQIPHELSDDNISRNASKQYKNKFIKRLIKNPPRLFTILGKLLIPNRALRQKLLRKIKIMNIEWKPRSELNPELYQELKNHYREEIENLSRLLNRDLVSLWDK